MATKLEGPPVEAARFEAAIPRAMAAPPRAEADVWEQVGHAVDPSRFRPALADDIEVKVFRLRWGNDYAIVRNPRDLVLYRLEVWEADLLELMDGTRTVGEIVVQRLEGSGDLDAGRVTELVELLRVGGFLGRRPADVFTAVTDALDSSSRFRRAARSLAKNLSVEWTGADRVVAAAYRNGIRAMFFPVSIVVAAGVAGLGLVAFAHVERSHVFRLDPHAAPAESIVLLALTLVLTFAHELGHAVVLTHHGRRIKAAGFMVYFGSPAFFVEASDSLMLDRGPRLAHSFAGPFAELILAGMASIAIFLAPGWGPSRVLYRFALLNYIVIFMNLVPMLELDGYWILTDLIQVSDLRPRSVAFIEHDLWHKLRKRIRLTPQEIGLGLYGFAGIVFTVFSLYTGYFFWNEVFGGLVASLWHGGLGSRLILVLLALALLGPVIRAVFSLTKAAFRRGRAVVSRVRFRLETSWRVEAAQLIDALPAFEDLPEDILSDLAGRVRLRTIANGQPVFRQGARATAFYVVRRGTIAIETEHPDSHDVETLATLERGASFGELGLVEGSTRRATARALGQSELFEIDKGTFDRLLADAIHVPEFGHTLQSLAELTDMAAFRHLQSDRLIELLQHGAWITAAPGETLVRQGEPGDAFYSILSGQVEVERDGVVVGSSGPGGYFGETALLNEAPRNATVTAQTPVRAFRLSREGFDRVIADAFRGGGLKPPIGRTWQH